VKKPSFVLDSYALLAHFQGEPSALKVKEIIKRAQDKDAVVFLSLINLGETIYTIGRRLGWDSALEALEIALMLPIQIGEVTMERVLAAARIKATLPISYADSFAVALAQEMSATVITGDPEFKRVESMVSVLWL
jgi:predicted nucleic acid-binding protein